MLGDLGTKYESDHVVKYTLNYFVYTMKYLENNEYLQNKILTHQ